MADLLARRTPATAATYLKVLKILYVWLVEEGEVPADPTVRIRPPIVPDQPVPIVPDPAGPGPAQARGAALALAWPAGSAHRLGAGDDAASRSGACR
jgi:hypothetical protein